MGNFREKKAKVGQKSCDIYIGICKAFSEVGTMADPSSAGPHNLTCTVIQEALVEGIRKLTLVCIVVKFPHIQLAIFIISERPGQWR